MLLRQKFFAVFSCVPSNIRPFLFFSILDRFYLFLPVTMLINLYIVIKSPLFHLNYSQLHLFQIFQIWHHLSCYSLYSFQILHMLFLLGVHITSVYSSFELIVKVIIFFHHINKEVKSHPYILQHYEFVTKYFIYVFLVISNTTPKSFSYYSIDIIFCPCLCGSNFTHHISKTWYFFCIKFHFPFLAPFIYVSCLYNSPTLKSL